MKKRKSLVIVLVIVFFILVCVLIYLFYGDLKKSIIMRSTETLNEYLYSIDSGIYSLKEGTLYNEYDEVVSDKSFISATGQIKVDKYKNISYTLNAQKHCINKTSTKKTNIYSGKCKNQDEIKVEYTTKNNIISFKFNKKVTSYKMSENDDFIGNWIDFKYNNTFSINVDSANKYYFWFKDSEGNISERIEFDSKCLLSDKDQFSKNTLYCIGSTIMIDNIEWLVLMDDNGSIDLMTLLPLEEKLSHCTDKVSQYCYVTEGKTNEYNWENSYINYYLNKVFVNKLSKKTLGSVKEISVCNTSSGVSGCDNGDGCGGYKKEIIYNYNWSCSEYIKTKIRLISYDEYTTAYDSLDLKTFLKGNYWTMNSSSESACATSINENGEVVTKENVLEKLDIRPFMSINKK